MLKIGGRLFMIKLGEYYVDRFLTVSALNPKTNDLLAVLKNVS